MRLKVMLAPVPLGRNPACHLTGLGDTLQNVPKSLINKICFRAVRKDSRIEGALRAPAFTLCSPGRGSGAGALGTGALGRFFCSPGGSSGSGTSGTSGTGTLGRSLRSPGGGSGSEHSGTGHTDVRLRYHSSNLVLGGSSARTNQQSGLVMITANDLSTRPIVGPILRTGGTNSQQEEVTLPGQPEGANWGKTPVTLHWCRDQDTHVETHVYLTQVEILDCHSFSTFP